MPCMPLFLIHSFDNDDMKASKRHVTFLTLIFQLKCFSKSFFIELRDRSFFYEGGGAGGIWEAPFKNRMTPPQLTNFFTCPPL